MSEISCLFGTGLLMGVMRNSGANKIPCRDVMSSRPGVTRSVEWVEHRKLLNLRARAARYNAREQDARAMGAKR